MHHGIVFSSLYCIIVFLQLLESNDHNGFFLLDLNQKGMYFRFVVQTKLEPTIWYYVVVRVAGVGNSFEDIGGYPNSRVYCVCFSSVIASYYT